MLEFKQGANVGAPQELLESMEEQWIAHTNARMDKSVVVNTQILSLCLPLQKISFAADNTYVKCHISFSNNFKKSFHGPK